MSLIERLRFVITHTKLRQKQIADLAGVHETAISQWLKGTTKEPRGSHLTKLAFATGFDPIWLIYGEGNPRGPMEVREPGTPWKPSRRQLEQAIAWRCPAASMKLGLVPTTHRTR